MVITKSSDITDASTAERAAKGLGVGVLGLIELGSTSAGAVARGLSRGLTLIKWSRAGLIKPCENVARAVAASKTNEARMVAKFFMVLI